MTGRSHPVVTVSKPPFPINSYFCNNVDPENVAPHQGLYSLYYMLGSRKFCQRGSNFDIF